jgi:molybdopterin-guanine dinucleotide biosynthesis protein A
VSGVVLAGGESRRMGSDKRALLVDGQPLLRRVLTAVAAVAGDLVVVESARSPVPRELLAGLHARVVADAWLDAGPLAGIEAGLRAMSAHVGLVVAADMPWLQPPLLRLLIDELDADDQAAVVASDRGIEPLPGAYRSGVSQVAHSLLQSGERRLAALLDNVPVRIVDASVWRRIDRDGESLRNLNAPGDLGGSLPRRPAPGGGQQ